MFIHTLCSPLRIVYEHSYVIFMSIYALCAQLSILYFSIQTTISNTNYIFCYNSSVLDYTYQTLNNDVPQTLDQTAVSYNYARGAGLERSTAINCTLSLDIDACITDGETELYHKRVLNQQKKDKEKKAVKSSQTSEGEKPSKTSLPTYNSVRDPQQRTVSSPEKPSPSLATPEDDDDDDEAEGSGTESDYTPEKEK